MIPTTPPCHETMLRQIAALADAIDEAKLRIEHLERRLNDMKAEVEQNPQ